jgi:hypothetical protein
MFQVRIGDDGRGGFSSGEEKAPSDLMAGTGTERSDCSKSKPEPPLSISTYTRKVL